MQYMSPDQSLRETCDLNASSVLISRSTDFPLLRILYRLHVPPGKTALRNGELLMLTSTLSHKTAVRPVHCLARGLALRLSEFSMSSSPRRSCCSKFQEFLPWNSCWLRDSLAGCSSTRAGCSAGYSIAEELPSPWDILIVNESRLFCEIIENIGFDDLGLKKMYTKTGKWARFHGRVFSESKEYTRKIKGYGLGRLFRSAAALSYAPVFFRSFWLLVGALQGIPENSRKFSGFLPKIPGNFAASSGNFRDPPPASVHFLPPYRPPLAVLGRQ